VEDAQQARLGLSLDRLLGQLAQGTNRLSHLLEVCAPAVARHEVRFEARPLERLHSALKVIGNKLHELLAGQIIDIVSHSKGSQ